MNGAKGLYRLQLDNETALDHEIGNIVSDDMAVKRYVDRDLSLDAESPFLQKNHERILINLLKVTEAKLAMDFHRNAYYFACQIVFLHFLSFFLS